MVEEDSINAILFFKKREASEDFFDILEDMHSQITTLNKKLISSSISTHIKFTPSSFNTVLQSFHNYYRNTGKHSTNFLIKGQASHETILVVI